MAANDADPDSQNYIRPLDLPKQPATPVPPSAVINKASHAKIILLGVVSIAIVAAVAILILNGFRLPYTGGNGPVYTNNQRTASPISSYLASPQNRTTKSVFTLLFKGLDTSTFNVSYAGSVVLSTGGSLLGALQFTIPVRLSYERYNNDSRLYINASGIPIFGNFTTYDIKSNGVEYSCSSSLMSNSSGIKCSVANSSSNFNITSMLDSIGNSPSVNESVSVPGYYSYIGQNCTVVVMAGTVKSSPNATSNPSVGGLTGIVGGAPRRNSTTAYNINMCMSDQYYVPLHMTASVSSIENNRTAATYNITLNAVSIGKPVTDAEVTALPGGIVLTTIPSGG